MNKLNLEELIGNDNIKTQLKISYKASKYNNRPMPHMLLCGLPGCGKTSTAKAISALGGSVFLEVSAESFSTAESIAEILEKLPEDGYADNGEILGEINPAIIFIDEAHRLTSKAQEMLGITMENWQHNFSAKVENKVEVIKTWVPRFTLICATTKEGELTKPFRDRFKLKYIFGSYSLSDSIKIIRMHANKRGVSIDDDSLVRIAQRSRGTPRLMVRYLEMVLDAMVSLQSPAVTVDIVEAQFSLMGIDSEGLKDEDVIILKTLYESSHPVGLETLSLKTNQDAKTVKEVNEPFLIIKGFMERGKQGRVITEAGKKHLESLGVIQPEKDRTSSRLLRRKL